MEELDIKTELETTSDVINKIPEPVDILKGEPWSFIEHPITFKPIFAVETNYYANSRGEVLGYNPMPTSKQVTIPPGAQVFTHPGYIHDPHKPSVVNDFFASTGYMGTRPVIPNTIEKLSISNVQHSFSSMTTEMQHTLSSIQHIKARAVANGAAFTDVLICTSDVAQSYERLLELNIWRHAPKDGASVYWANALSTAIITDYEQNVPREVYVDGQIRTSRPAYTWMMKSFSMFRIMLECLDTRQRLYTQAAEIYPYDLQQPDTSTTATNLPSQMITLSSVTSYSPASATQLIRQLAMCMKFPCLSLYLPDTLPSSSQGLADFIVYLSMMPYTNLRVHQKRTLLALASALQLTVDYNDKTENVASVPATKALFDFWNALKVKDGAFSNIEGTGHLSAYDEEDIIPEVDKFVRVAGLRSYDTRTTQSPDEALSQNLARIELIYGPVFAATKRLLTMLYPPKGGFNAAKGIDIWKSTFCTSKLYPSLLALHYKLSAQPHSMFSGVWRRGKLEAFPGGVDLPMSYAGSFGVLMYGVGPILALHQVITPKESITVPLYEDYLASKFGLNSAYIYWVACVEYLSIEPELLNNTATFFKRAEEYIRLFINFKISVELMNIMRRYFLIRHRAIPPAKHREFYYGKQIPDALADMYHRDIQEAWEAQSHLLDLHVYISLTRCIIPPPFPMHATGVYGTSASQVYIDKDKSKYVLTQHDTDIARVRDIRNLMRLNPPSVEAMIVMLHAQGIVLVPFTVKEDRSQQVTDLAKIPEIKPSNGLLNDGPNITLHLGPKSGYFPDRKSQELTIFPTHGRVFFTKKDEVKPLAGFFIEPVDNNLQDLVFMERLNSELPDVFEIIHKSYLKQQSFCIIDAPELLWHAVKTSVDQAKAYYNRETVTYLTN